MLKNTVKEELGKRNKNLKKKNIRPELNLMTMVYMQTNLDNTKTKKNEKYTNKLSFNSWVKTKIARVINPQKQNKREKIRMIF